MSVCETCSDQMKYYFLILCMLVLVCSPESADAQIGLKIGTSISSFYYPGSPPSPYDGYDIDLRPFLGYDVEFAQVTPQLPLVSPGFSIYRSFNLSQRISVQPELCYSRKGVRFSQVDYEKVDYKVKINYLEIPVSVALQVLEKNNSRIDCFLGGYGAFRISVTKQVAYNNSSVEKEKINTMRIFEGGLHTGITYKHRFLDGFVVIGLRVYLGLTDIFELPEDWTGIYLDTHKTKITGLNLSLGYEF